MPELKVFALKKLDMIVDEFWPEISEAIEKMYVIYMLLFNLLYSFDEVIRFHRSFLYISVKFFMKINHFLNMI